MTGPLTQQGGVVLLSTLEGRPPSEPGDDAPHPSPARTHVLWFCDALLLFFLISWVSTSVLRLDNDLYYAIFIWSALTFLNSYRRATNSKVIEWLQRRWRSSLFIGLLVAVYLVVNVLNANATAHPDGMLLVFEVMWRGVAYGIVDSLVLTAFPLAVARGVFHDMIDGWVRRVGLGCLTLTLVWVMSTTYHLGFSQFDDDIVTPQLTSTVASLPAVISANPIGSIAAQVALHVVATVQTFESNVFVPPQVEFVPQYEPPGIFGPH